ncbi:MAG: hypothetical protein ABF306_12810 [Nocardioides marinisabuli]|uniref:hypothetical protein n=1 Tax=Nocardioides marinisabuli TaxID=419476 RepID=UPI00321B8D92
MRATGLTGLTGLVGLLLTAVVVGGCADEGSSPSQPSPGEGVAPTPTSPAGPSEDAAGEPAPFQARPVLAAQGRSPDGLDPALARRLEALDCLRKPPSANGPGGEAMLACDARGAGFLLGPTGVDGGVDGVEVVEVDGGYAVQVALDEAAAGALDELVRGLVGSEGRFAVVVDGTLVALPRVADGIGATLQVGDGWSRAEADDVAARLT